MLTEPSSSSSRALSSALHPIRRGRRRPFYPGDRWLMCTQAIGVTKGDRNCRSTVTLDWLYNNCLYWWLLYVVWSDCISFVIFDNHKTPKEYPDDSGSQILLPSKTTNVCMPSHFSHVWLFVTLWTVAHQASLSIGFSRQEDWSGLPCPPPRDLPDPGIQPASLMPSVLAGGFFITRATWEPQNH